MTKLIRDMVFTYEDSWKSESKIFLDVDCDEFKKILDGFTISTGDDGYYWYHDTYAIITRNIWGYASATTVPASDVMKRIGEWFRNFARVVYDAMDSGEEVARTYRIEITDVCCDLKIEIYREHVLKAALEAVEVVRKPNMPSSQSDGGTSKAETAEAKDGNIELAMRPGEPIEECAAGTGATSTGMSGIPASEGANC